MEWRLAFTEFLLAFCAVVLADRVYGFSERLAAALRGTHSVRDTPQPALAAGLAGDWYVHFYRSDLTGEKPVRRRETLASRPRVGAPGVCRPRPDARPRLRA